LWQGPDHLLLVMATSVTERYKRFYYRDIQAIITRRTKLRMAWNLVFGACAVIFGIPSLLMWLATSIGEGSKIIAISGSTVAFVFLLLLLTNSLRGATCACHVQTAVQLEKLSPLNRLRIARKVLARIKPLIDAAQQTGG